MSRPESGAGARRRPAAKKDLRRWVPALVAVGVLVIVVIAAQAGDGDGSTGAATTTAATIADLSSTTSGPPVVIETNPQVPHTQLTQPLGQGSSGDEVKLVQQRLTDLAFSPGPIDGAFGSGTQQAVWAFEKLVLQTPRGAVTGVVTNEMWQTMQNNLLIGPLRPTGAGTTHVEIYVPQQVLIVFTDDKPKLIAHISTGMQLPDGSPDHFCEYADFNTDAQGVPLATILTKYVCADTKTPGGVFAIDHKLPGDHVGPLGGMFNPVYFNYGIAIHGAMNVPKKPVSHGCVRLNETIAGFFPDLVNKGDKVFVWAQDGRQPEDYSQAESYPSFNAVTDDPNATTTTVAPTTTTSPASTTTIAAPTTTAMPTPTTTATTVAPTTTAPTVAPPATG